MSRSRWKQLSAAACVILLSACATDGVSLRAGGPGGGGGGGAPPGGNPPGGGGGDAPAGRSFIGDGSITVSSDGTTMNTPSLLDKAEALPAVGGIVTRTTDVADSLLTTGNAVLPVVAGPVASVTQPLTASLPLGATLADTQLTGSGDAKLGLGVLSKDKQTGSVASLNVLSGGKALGVSVSPSSLTSVGGGLTSIVPVSVTAADHTVAGGASPVLGVGLLSKDPVAGSAASLHVLSDGKLVGVSGPSGASLTGSLTGSGSAGGAAGLVSGVTSTVSGVLGSSASLGGAGALLGASGSGSASVGATSGLGSTLGGLPVIGQIVR